MAARVCMRCDKKKGFLSPNYAGTTVSRVKYPGEPNKDYLCGNCFKELEPELREQQKAAWTCMRCGKEKGFLSPNYAGTTVLRVKYPGEPNKDYLCGNCFKELGPELREQQKAAWMCMRCDKKKGFLSLNYAGMTRSGVKYPGEPNKNYLCENCQKELEPELREQQSKEDDGIKKPRERTYSGLNIPRAVVVQEVKSYLEVNQFLNPEVKEEADRTIITGGDLAVIIAGTPDRFTVTAGPRTVILDLDAGKIFVAPLFVLIAKGIGVAWDKYKVDKFFEHLDATLYARAARASAQEGEADGVVSKIRELAKLRDDGLLTEQEFQAKKVELLAKM